MQCFVYRSRNKADTYLYLPVRDDFSQVPDALMQVFGIPEFTFDFELTPERRLASADAASVIAGLQERGFFLQMPPNNERPA